VETLPAEPEYRYYRSRVTEGVWRMPVSGGIGNYRAFPSSPWGPTEFNEPVLIAERSPYPCDESGQRLSVVPEAVRGSAFRIRPGYRYRTRDGHTTDHVEPSGDPNQPFSCLVEGGYRMFSPDGNWMGDGRPESHDLVEEIIPTTIEEWLHTIPESEAALRNMRTLGCCGGASPSDEAGNAHDALWLAFTWDRSPEGHAYWRSVVGSLYAPHAGTVGQSAAHPTPAPAPAPPSPPPPAPKQKYRITEVRHYFLEAEDEIEADRMFRDATDPARRFRVRIEDREIHNDA